MNQPVARRSAETPLGDVFLSRLYRAQPGEVAGLVEPLTPMTRVHLAMFCYGRAHLRSIGREVAQACEEADLRRYAPGAVGASLIEARRAKPSDDFGTLPGGARRPRVTLASAADMRRKPIVFEEEEDPVPDETAPPTDTN